jgi:hypothetical protein
MLEYWRLAHARSPGMRHSMLQPDGTLAGVLCEQTSGSVFLYHMLLQTGLCGRPTQVMLHDCLAEMACLVSTVKCSALLIEEVCTTCRCDWLILCQNGQSHVPYILNGLEEVVCFGSSSRHHCLIWLRFQAALYDLAQVPETPPVLGLAQVPAPLYDLAQVPETPPVLGLAQVPAPLYDLAQVPETPPVLGLAQVPAPLYDLAQVPETPPVLGLAQVPAALYDLAQVPGTLV